MCGDGLADIDNPRPLTYRPGWVVGTLAPVVAPAAGAAASPRIPHARRLYRPNRMPQTS